MNFIGWVGLVVISAAIVFGVYYVILKRINAKEAERQVADLKAALDKLKGGKS